MHHRRMLPIFFVTDARKDIHYTKELWITTIFSSIFIISDFPNCSFSICNQFEILTLKFINFNIFRVFRFNVRYWNEYSFYPMICNILNIILHSSFFFTIIFAVLLNTIRVHSHRHCQQLLHSTHFLLERLFSFCYYCTLTDLISFRQIPSWRAFQLISEMWESPFLFL